MMNPPATGYYQLPTQVSHIAGVLNQIPVKSYLVGGVLRDSILGANNPDIDIAVIGSASSVAKKAAIIMDGRSFPLDNSRDISRVIASVSGVDIQIDVTSAQNGISSDIAKRDFTINTLALDINDIKFNSRVPEYEISKIIDEHNGIKDLSDGVLRMTTNQVFDEDSLRVLRAARIAAQCHLNIDEVTEVQIRKSSSLISKASPERIRDEFLKILSFQKSTQNITRMDDLGILTNVVPELEASRKTSQPPNHHWDVLEHMVQTAGQAENIVRGKVINVGPYPTFINFFIPREDLHRDYFRQSYSDGHNRSTFLKLSSLLHDIAKPNTKTIDPNGKMRFLKHDKLGGEMAYSILKRLKFSNAGIELVKNQIENHLRPSQISNLGQEPTIKAVTKYYKDTDGASLDILYLNMADYIATKGPNLTRKEWKDHCKKIEIIQNHESSYKKAINQRKLLSGHDIMFGLCLKPGPLIGLLIEEVEEARMEKLVSNKEEALELIKRRMASGEYIA